MSDPDPLVVETTPRNLAFDAYAVANRLAGLDLRARWLVHGLTAGLHRSIRKGFSTEFSDLREFQPGDDPARIDWRAFARRQRLMTKTYEAETNLRAGILVDVSASMRYTDPYNTRGPGWSKHEYAVTLAAALALIFARQNDSLAVATFADGLKQLTPFRSSRNHLQRCWQMLSMEQPAGVSNVEQALRSFAAFNQRAGMVLVISDFLTPPAGLDAGLQMLRAARQEIILFQVLTPSERDAGGGQLAGRKLREPERRIEAVLPADVKIYTEKVRAHVNAIRAAAHRNGALYVFVPTETALEHTLIRFFTSRRRMR